LPFDAAFVPALRFALPPALRFVVAAFRFTVLVALRLPAVAVLRLLVAARFAFAGALARLALLALRGALLSAI
jgi:hypothetical protein